MHAQRVRPKVSFLSAIAAESGVEPELYSSTPRCVVDTRSTRRAHLWGANLIAGMILLLYYFARVDDAMGEAAPSFVLFASLYGAIWFVVESKTRRSRRFLRDGYAVRATVEKCELSENELGHVDIRYVYIAMDGKQAGGYLTLTTDEESRIGGFAVGTTFTVLLHPTERYEVLPYFQVSGVELPGAAPVRTTRP